MQLKNEITSRFIVFQKFSDAKRVLFCGKLNEYTQRKQYFAIFSFSLHEIKCLRALRWYFFCENMKKKHWANSSCRFYWEGFSEEKWFFGKFLFWPLNQTLDSSENRMKIWKLLSRPSICILRMAVSLNRKMTTIYMRWEEATTFYLSFEKSQIC